MGLKMVPVEEWWSIFEAKGARIWPAQIVFYIVGILLIGWIILKAGLIQSWFTKLYLAIAFACTGIVFSLLIARDIIGDSYGNYFLSSISVLPINKKGGYIK
jgi:hypothetical protein